MLNLVNAKSFFIKNGYVLLPGFIPKKKVLELRNLAEEKLAIEKEHTLKPTTFLKQNEMTETIFSDQFFGVMQSLDTKYLHYLPNYTVRKNLVINWHCDDEFLVPDKEKLPGIIQCNIYLQDNHPEYGGGIDISPNSHQLDAAEKKKLIADNSFKFETVMGKAGDLLLFDYRAIHRSSMPKKERSDARMALQWTMAKNKDRANMFMQYILRRIKEKIHLSDFTDKRALCYFYDAVNIEFPNSFTKKVVQFVVNKNIEIEVYDNTLVKKAQS